MMYASHMMLPSAMMCPAGHMGFPEPSLRGLGVHIGGKHHIIVSECEQHHFGAMGRNIISRLWRRHHFGLFCGGTITMRTDALRQIENHM